MKKVLVNALSVSNQSGVHVVGGHLQQCVEQLCDEARFVVLCREDSPLRIRLGNLVDWLDAPLSTSHWFRRWIWERMNLHRLIRNHGIAVYFTGSGIAASFIRVPQVVLCQNPWAFVRTAHKGLDKFKAWIQRRAYRTTMKKAEVVVFLSEYMKKAYRKNAGLEERKGIIAYPGLPEKSRERAEKWKNCPRVPGQIVCVSAMASHKNIETLLKAFKKLEDGNVEKQKTEKLKIENDEAEMSELSDFQDFSISNFQNLSLHLVGAWPDAAYEQKIKKQVEELKLEGRVVFAGHVSRERLDQYYAESQIYAMVSRCESFGIPAAEAQLFGTPVVCSNVCAVPEIAGQGGSFCNPDDIEAVAAAMKHLLDDKELWAECSRKAKLNSERFRWESCAQPLIEAFKDLLD